MKTVMRSALFSMVAPLALAAAALATQHPSAVTVSTAGAQAAALRAWDARVERMRRDGELELQRTRADAMMAGRTHERFDQYHRGVRVFGADVTRQSSDGLTVSIFGTLYRDIDLDVTATLSGEMARARVEELSGATLGAARQPELVVLPLDEGGFALAWRLTAFSVAGGWTYFIDAHSGALRLRIDAVRRQAVTPPAAVGTGPGVLGDTKKISTMEMGGTFVTMDELRPPAIKTYDLDGDLVRFLAFLNGFLPPSDADLARDADNRWEDGANVDAHVYAGWTYDYLFKRFGRSGLDDADIPIQSFVHVVKREDFESVPPEFIGDFYLNAAYLGDGFIFYGEGLPPGFVLSGTGQRVDFLAGALDVVAHELAHGVTDFSSGLIYRNESGALNEAFSDVIGVGAEFFFQEAGDGLRRADYLIGEDVFVPGGIRSLGNPRQFDNPDHYSRRFTGTDDNGGVHINSLIPGHAFYLAIEGGTNRTSNLSVEGVGAANREQIERVFYRAFALMLPANATFAVARRATIQAARDLFGTGSAPERAVTQAWTAVGVQ